MKFCEQCEILFDCDYNKNKHDEIIHLKSYPVILPSSISDMMKTMLTGAIIDRLRNNVKQTDRSV